MSQFGIFCSAAVRQSVNGPSLSLFPPQRKKRWSAWWNLCGLFPTERGCSVHKKSHFLLLTPWPLPHPPLYKKLHFVSLLRAPLYLLDGMLPDSWMIEWSQLDLQIRSAEFFFLIVFLSLSSCSRGCFPAVGVFSRSQLLAAKLSPCPWKALSVSLQSSLRVPASPGQPLLQFWLLPGGSTSELWSYHLLHPGLCV